MSCNDELVGFLSIPITANLNEDGTAFRADREAFYSSAVAQIETHGVKVLCAGTNEEWGRVKLPPRDFVRFDVESIRCSDLLIVLASERASRDIYLEVGIAVGRGIPTLVLLQRENYEYATFMLKGLASLGDLRLHHYDSEDEVADLLNDSLRELLSDAGLA